MHGNHQESGAAELPADSAPAAGTGTPATRTPTKRKPSGDRAGLLAGAVVLAACAALVGYGVLGGGSSGTADTARTDTPTASVTYEVTGTGVADLTYQADRASGTATVVHGARLPWHRTVDVPLGEQPILSVVLDGDGGQAHCNLAVRGRHLQSATASGKYGRATCAGELPSPQASDG